MSATFNRGWVALVLCVLLASTGCSMAKSAGAPASGARGGSPSTRPPAPGYASFVSANQKYSLEYPAAWYDTGPELLDGQFDAKNFSSQEIQSPIQLSDTGIWLTVTVDTKPRTCLSRPGPANSAKPMQVSIDGVSGVAYITLAVDPNFQGGNGFTGITGPYVKRNGWCYWFGFLTTSYVNTNLHMAEIQHIYSSFRFNR